MFLVALLLWQSNLDQAQSLLKAGRVDEADVAVKAALRESPQSVKALTLQGRIAMAQNDFDVAKRSLQQAVSLAPDDAGVHFLLGFCHYVDNDFVQAQPVLDRARRMAPSDARTTLFLALTHEGLARPSVAEDLFKQTLRLEARAQRPNVESFVAYARMLYTQGRLDEAQVQVAAALRLEPHSGTALYEQARLDFERGKFADSVERAKQALQAESDAVTPRQIHFLLSRAYSRLGDAHLAAEHRRQFESMPARLIR